MARPIPIAHIDAALAPRETAALHEAMEKLAATLCKPSDRLIADHAAHRARLDEAVERTVR